MPFRSVAPTHHEARSPLRESDVGSAPEEDRESNARVQIDSEDETALATLHRTLTGNNTVNLKAPSHPRYGEPHISFRDFFEQTNRALEEQGQPVGHLGVCFRGVTTWGAGGGNARVKTMADAVWRTVTFQDVYEWTLKKWFFKDKIESGRPLIRDFSGVCRPGEIML